MLVSNVKRGALEASALTVTYFLFRLDLTFILIRDYMTLFKMIHVLLEEYGSLISLHEFVFDQLNTIRGNLE